jgi:hypothetical protein
MRLRMSKILRFWVDCECEVQQEKHLDWARSQLLAEILRKYEEAGDAMRYLNSRGQVAWKASPRMLVRLADAEREVEDDWADCG